MAEKMVQPRWMDEPMVGWKDWLTQREGYWGANLELQSLWGSCLAEKMVQLRLRDSSRAGLMAVPRHLAIRMASTLALRYPLESNLVG